MEISDITIELMFDKIKTMEQEINRLRDRVNSLESQLTEIKSADKLPFSTPSATFDSTEPARRDKTKYMLNGNVYLKNRLVLAVVRDFAEKCNNPTRQQLKMTFDKTLQGSIGVVEDEEIARQKSDCDIRFFTKPDEVIKLADGNMFVCSQWGILNIPRFLARAKELGYEITEIKS